MFQGENRFIESICQTIFSVPELMELLNDRNVDANLKKPFLRLSAMSLNEAKWILTTFMRWLGPRVVQPSTRHSCRRNLH